MGEPKRRRRWWQFSLRAILVIPFVVFAAAWWLVDWPVRTIDKFNQHVANGDFGEATKMIDCEDWKVQVHREGFILERAYEGGNVELRAAGEFPLVPSAPEFVYAVCARRDIVDWKLVRLEAKQNRIAISVRTAELKAVEMTMGRPLDEIASGD